MDSISDMLNEMCRDILSRQITEATKQGDDAMSTKRAFEERDRALLKGDSDLFPEVERCSICDEPTGKAGRDEDSLYDGSDGPYCQDCWDRSIVAKADYRPIETAVALSLYAYNVSAQERAQRLFDHFQGRCAYLSSLENTLRTSPQYAATELAFPTAVVYVQHALQRYGEEARRRINTELEP